MYQILKPNVDIVRTEMSALSCEVEQYLGGGGQGEVYRAKLDGKEVALKWYFTHYLTQDERLRERLEMAISGGAPSDRFLWPVDIASSPDVAAFGYVMRLREERFKGIVDLMKRRAEPSFRALATAGFELAHNYLQLHSRGLCYRDISFGNVFFDPVNGEVRICDNDNVDVNGKEGPIGGTPRFMAPELVRGDATPSTQTDLFSLAVLLFYMFVIHHPLEGANELKIHSFDLPAMRRLYGTNPVFIFDPADDTNRPVAGYHDNALVYWPIYPEFFQRLFIRSFTDGLRDPQHGRVREGEWRPAMIRLRDSIIYCASCGAENFYDADRMKATGSKPPACWHCKRDVPLPFRIRIGRNIVMLNSDTKLYPHHLDEENPYDFSAPAAEVSQHPKNPSLWGLKNLSGKKWVRVTPEGTQQDVVPGQSVTLARGMKIHFGKADGEIRY
jgi:DNA-binding helix-hairpin-helix protein with protein kinase domain